MYLISVNPQVFIFSKSIIYTYTAYTTGDILSLCFSLQQILFSSVITTISYTEARSRPFTLAFTEETKLYELTFMPQSSLPLEFSVVSQFETYCCLDSKKLCGLVYNNFVKPKVQ